MIFLEDSLDFFLPESADAVKEAMRLPAVRPYQASILTKNGEVRIVQVRVRIIDYDGQSARVAMIMDITEQVNARKQIEELAARAESEKNRLRTILETMPVAVSIFDASGRLIEHNAIAEKYTSLNDMSVHATGERKRARKWWANTGLPVQRHDRPLIKAITAGTTTISDVIRCRTARWEEDDDNDLSSPDTR